MKEQTETGGGVCMKDRHYEIFSGDTAVAVWKDQKLTVLNEALLPLYLRRIQNLN